MKPGKKLQQKWNSFKTCGISNALDRTEGDELYSEEGHDINDDKENGFNLCLLFFVSYYWEIGEKPILEFA